MRYATLALVLLFALPAWAQPIFPDLTGAELRAALVAEYKPASVFNYNVARDSMFAVLDFEGEGPVGTVRGVYTDWPVTIDRTSSTAPRTQAFNQGVDTEHTWPQSLGAGSGNARSDLHHLFPTRSDANNSRGNLPFADVPVALVSRWWYLDQSPTSPPEPPYGLWSKTSSSLQAFEPRDAHKGRVARAMVYFYTMYADQANDAFFELQAETFYAWHVAYPPTEAEEARTFTIAQWQDGKPNPFVLDTSLVRRAFFEGDGDPGPGEGPEGEFEAVYTFENTFSCENEDPSVTQQPANVTFSAFERTGVQCNQGAGVFNSRGWPTGTLDESAYVGFMIVGNEVDGGNWQVAFVDDELSFVSRRSGTGPDQAEVRIRINDGAWTTLATWSPTTSDATTTVSLPTVEGADSVAVRIYAWGASSAAGTLRFDDVTVTGDQVAPPVSIEPVREREAMSVQVYPNPSRSLPTVTFTTDAQETEITVYDVLGREVGHEAVRGTGRQTVGLETVVSELAGGVYFVRVVSASGATTLRFTVFK